MQTTPLHKVAKMHRLKAEIRIKERRRGTTLTKMRMTKAYATHLERNRTDIINR